MPKIQKFLLLNSRDRRLLITTFLLLNSIRVGFLFLKFPALQKLLAKIGEPAALPPIQIDRLIWAVNVSTSLSPGSAKCLARALTTQTLLRQQGYLSQLQIGVLHQPATEFQAHAWIEYQGKIIMGELADLDRYNTLHPL